MDFEPKRWRLLADALYDIGTGLEVLSPWCPHLFLEMAGLGNFAKGMAVVAARATRLPIYSSFAKEGNLSDLFAKGEAFSTLFNVIGIGVGIQLASTICGYSAEMLNLLAVLQKDRFKRRLCIATAIGNISLQKAQLLENSLAAEGTQKGDSMKLFLSGGYCVS
ncbi:protein root UVB sensitive 2, chloroplastic-like [Glycine max]|uniref:protein root UVB sensitive 2, chloroplastic-like n=1 Tax=Glycine max TaxID=3847 RepID=UPI0003DEA8F4|nr:protein root UVB sensitive 2, chloroplastic-like [Glycine max]|eukprot:XP_006574013.1 protein root UVB sensitive 2, chloroplastic-like [Glycine max]